MGPEYASGASCPAAISLIRCSGCDTYYVVWELYTLRFEIRSAFASNADKNAAWVTLRQR